MKAIVLVLTALSILFLTGCSDLGQDSSPVTPDLQKVSSHQVTPNGTYEYLQSFAYVPVQSINSTKDPNSVEIIISPDKMPKFFLHMYVLIEYNDFAVPIEDKLIFVGKPTSNLIKLENIELKNLKSVKVYAYIPDLNGNGIAHPYNYLTKFEELEIEQWSSGNAEIIIITNEWKSNLADTFVELNVVNGDELNYVLAYIARPDHGKIVLPKFVKGTITEVKMYGHFNEVVED